MTNQSGAITDLAYRQDSARLVSTSLDANRSAVTWEVIASRQILGQTLAVFEGPVNGLAFDPGSGALAAVACVTEACSAAEVQLFDGETFSAQGVISGAIAIDGAPSFGNANGYLALPRADGSGVDVYDSKGVAPAIIYEAPAGSTLTALAPV